MIQDSRFWVQDARCSCYGIAKQFHKVAMKLDKEYQAAVKFDQDL